MDYNEEEKRFNYTQTSRRVKQVKEDKTMKNQFFETYVQDYQTGTVIANNLYSSLDAAREDIKTETILAQINGYKQIDIEIVQKHFTGSGTLTTTIRNHKFVYKVGRCVEIPKDTTKIEDLVNTIFQEEK